MIRKTPQRKNAHALQLQDKTHKNRKIEIEQQEARRRMFAWGLVDANAAPCMLGIT